MRALLLTDSGPLLKQDYPIPVPQHGQALIRVTLAGICSTDLQLIAGYKGGYRGVLGHEFVGVVEHAPGNEGWEGKRVVGELNVGCGKCDLCRRGLGKHCRARQSLGIIGLDGAFAEYLVLPVANLHELPSAATMPDEIAVFVEPTAAALQIREQLAIAPSTRVYVLGSGRLGLLVAQVLALTGCELTVVGRTAAKLNLLSQMALPLRTYCTGTEGLQGITEAADVVVDVTGAPQGFALARQLVRPGGTIVIKSTFAGNLPELDLSALVVDEISLIGSRCGPFAPAIRLLAGGLVQTQSLIHSRYPLQQGLAALQTAAQPGVLKVLLQMPSTR
ncbi:MAG: alcohol dehydrogenase catalytic domain-containing protein [Caldilineaceae bacterium]|nr:alcohol dehydrogenase catalytic domain-containing protein [Caldilineaceae bacterium]